MTTSTATCRRSTSATSLGSSCTTARPENAIVAGRNNTHAICHYEDEGEGDELTGDHTPSCVLHAQYCSAASRAERAD